MNTTLTLTLNRIWFEKIAAGEKLVEYRKDSEFYTKLFREPKRWRQIVFHFYRRERLKCQIVSIKKIPRPQQFKESTYLTTAKVWAITLRNPQTYTVSKP